MKIITAARICILTNIAILILSSCANSPNQREARDNDKCMETVQKEYPKAIVWKCESKYEFIVCDDSCGAVYYIKTLDSESPNITSKVVIKPCK